MEKLNEKILKQKLLEERSTLQQRLQEEEENVEIERLRSPDDADLAWAYNQRMKRTALLPRNEKQIEEIDAALQRMEEGMYGKCTNCDQEIHPDRLDAIPWASLCINCQQLEEK